MNILGSIFSETVAVLVGSAIRANVPDNLRWIADLVQATWIAVGTVDDVQGMSGEDKFKTVVEAIKVGLDTGMDGVPGLDDLDEATRDQYLGFLTEVTATIYHLVQGGAEFDAARRTRIADACRGLVLAIFATVDAAEGREAPKVVEPAAVSHFARFHALRAVRDLRGR